ncbi:MAG: hypothetical protein COY55_08840 [Flavobacteriaceae bacterium CG_4_10_14_0_8_um_filter_31_99]|nr:MAG: hypothetical protein COW43_03830 [Flavobacteriaceae bacterium CG17_big_fil_post_rev_8_21_14_2_50_31_13]PIX12732.1 MAG: hypothetical protein COZ74_10000 [Flavobacteriaceae bacterium CG_4_8_14_3_um_filter_31_8]PIZ10382.1 MAG: hypothetical protein COY55_08840 [Flavobacteriaceae bacterium CG_4_10_14_0_8_um_filter_31_99]
MKDSNTGILNFVRKWLIFIAIISAIFEMIFFPKFENFIGCIMTLIAVFIYTKFVLKRLIILQYPFAFLLFTSIFLYRYLPLTSTLIEGNQITFGMQLPIETFFYEIILFLFSFVAFYVACPNKILKRNNVFQKILYKINFFEIKSNIYPILWGMGLFGLFIKVYTFGVTDTELSNTTQKFLAGLIYLVYAPILLLFPSLINQKKNKNSSNIIIIIYVVLITVLNIASNSREQLIEPFFIIIILFLINSLKNNIPLTDLVSPSKITLIGLFLIFGLNFFTDVSLAMIYNRSIRKDIDKIELFEKTISTYKDEELMKTLKSLSNSDKVHINSYQKGWDETYIDNFMLNRYANMRISDQTLYYAKLRGFNYPQIQEYYKNRVTAIFPTPILNALGIRFDKEIISFSPGDLLFGDGLGGFRVSSHVGTGLSTFGFVYFIIQFTLLFIVFKLLNTFVFYEYYGFKYAPYGLMSVFVFVGMFRNASGWISDLTFILRGYIQGIFTFFLIYFILRIIFIKKY